MKFLIPYILLISFSITELVYVASEFLDDPIYLMDVSNSFPDHDGDNEDDPIKERLENSEKVLSGTGFYSFNHFVLINVQYKAYKKNYRPPHKKIPVPPPELY